MELKVTPIPVDVCILYIVHLRMIVVEVMFFQYKSYLFERKTVFYFWELINIHQLTPYWEVHPDITLPNRNIRIGELQIEVMQFHAQSPYCFDHHRTSYCNCIKWRLALNARSFRVFDSKVFVFSLTSNIHSYQSMNLSPPPCL